MIPAAHSCRPATMAIAAWAHASARCRRRQTAEAASEAKSPAKAMGASTAKAMARPATFALRISHRADMKLWWSTAL
eukprot:12009880-Alexandrium_andersonii.AAC.1